ncbi:UbiA prenyltransferase family protein [Candidatus Microgenomates bacterium]|nr:UbiA prenyltransferase family protein [Candidatus Microgenomates bacterium]
MVNKITALIASARPTHWVKNLLLFAPLIFSGNLTNGELFIATAEAVAIFSLAVSGIYMFNDIVDRNRDRLHPVKRRRPIAQGTLSLPVAFFTATVFIVSALFLASFISFFFLFALVVYLLLQVGYTLLFKHIPVADILAIAAGFVLRVWAGAFVIDVHLSVWFLLCVISTSLFLAAGKRKAELAILHQFGKVREFVYENTLLDAFLTMFGTATWLSWALFTFFEPSPNIGLLPLSSDLPLTLGGIGKWLMLTIPVVIFGIMRYLFIALTFTPLAESPERTLIRDRQLLGAVVLWGGLMILILYS